jgi:predicted transcriptional regulator
MRKKIYRERVEIIGSILQGALEPKTKPHLQKYSNTAFAQFNEIYDALLKTGYLVKINQGTRYKTSNEGADFLKKINEIKPHLDRVKRCMMET